MKRVTIQSKKKPFNIPIPPEYEIDNSYAFPHFIKYVNSILIVGTIALMFTLLRFGVTRPFTELILRAIGANTSAEVGSTRETFLMCAILLAAFFVLYFVALAIHETIHVMACMANRRAKSANGEHHRVIITLSLKIASVYYLGVLTRNESLVHIAAPFVLFTVGLVLPLIVAQQFALAFCVLLVNAMCSAYDLVTFACRLRNTSRDTYYCGGYILNRRQ